MTNVTYRLDTVFQPILLTNKGPYWMIEGNYGKNNIHCKIKHEVLMSIINESLRNELEKTLQDFKNWNCQCLTIKNEKLRWFHEKNIPGKMLFTCKLNFSPDDHEAALEKIPI